jgi:hypothetical protein
MHPSIHCKKTLYRSLVSLLPADIQAVPLAELVELQTEYRTYLTAKQELIAQYEHKHVMKLHHDTSPDVPKTNGDYLKKTQQVEAKNTELLKAGLVQIELTREVAAHTAQTLAEDRDKITRIGGKLDVVAVELEVSRRLITNLVKRLYTDKILISMVCLILVGIIGIGIYAALNPGQTTFNVPDVVKPPV